MKVISSEFKSFERRFLNMKTKLIKSEKEFDTVKTFREIKDKLSIDLSNMTFEQIKAYLKSNSLKFQNQ